MSKDGIGGADADSQPVPQSGTLAEARGKLPPPSPQKPRVQGVKGPKIQGKNHLKTYQFYTGWSGIPRILES
jgi:hypothetical protein